jgi:hypothetical protein
MPARLARAGTLLARVGCAGTAAFGLSTLLFSTDVGPSNPPFLLVLVVSEIELPLQTLVLLTTILLVPRSTRPTPPWLALYGLGWLLIRPLGWGALSMQHLWWAWYGRLQ